MRVLSNVEAVDVYGGMGNGPSGGNSYTPVNKGNPPSASGMGVIGGAVAGFFGALAASTPIGAIGVGVGAMLGGYIAGGMGPL